MKKLWYPIIVVVGLWAYQAHSQQTIREYVNTVVNECSEVAVVAEEKYGLNNKQAQALFFKCLSLDFEEFSEKLIEANKARKKGEYQM